jgi:hypothetical protein
MRGRGADAQRVAVGGRTDGAADPEAAGGAGNVLDDDGLAPAGNGTIMVTGRAG